MSTKTGLWPLMCGSKRGSTKEKGGGKRISMPGCRRIAKFAKLTSRGCIRLMCLCARIVRSQSVPSMKVLPVAQSFVSLHCNVPVLITGIFLPFLIWILGLTYFRISFSLTVWFVYNICNISKAVLFLFFIWLQ